MKRFFLCAFIFIASYGSILAQSPDLIIRHNENGYYLDHKVTAKENFYSIGRLYNVSPKEIAALNKLDMSKGLDLAQMIRIPLVSTNFSQSNNKGTPIYDKQSSNKLIVGYLISNEMAPVVVKKNETEKTEVVRQQPTVKPKTEEPAIKSEPKLQANEKGFFKSSFDEQVKANPLSKNETLTAGIFKTASGWQDEKYYLLIDGISPGKIVKIVNPENNIAVYAKVLGEMSGIRQNDGLNIRISNSAASVLEIPDVEKFIVKVNY